MKSTYPLPEHSQRKGGVVRRVSHLRPDSNESEHVIGSNRKPTINPNYTLNVFRDGVPDTTGKIFFHCIAKHAAVIIHRQGMLYTNDDALNKQKASFDTHPNLLL